MAFGNPTHTYSFRVEVDGIDQWQIQSITLPEQSVSVIEHGGGDHNIKTAGKRAIGNATLKHLNSLAGDNQFGYNWLMLTKTGVPAAYKKIVIVKELGQDNISTVKTWTLMGCFPIRKSQNDLDRMAAENTLVELELSVDEVIES